MTTADNDVTPMKDPLTLLENELITAYLAGTGHDVEALRARHDAEARTLLAAASLYASTRLTEIESRLHYLHSLRGEA
jgi:hypothetical protein